MWRLVWRLVVRRLVVRRLVVRRLVVRRLVVRRLVVWRLVVWRLVVWRWVRMRRCKRRHWYLLLFKTLALLHHVLIRLFYRRRCGHMIMDSVHRTIDRCVVLGTAVHTLIVSSIVMLKVERLGNPTARRRLCGEPR